MTEATLDLREKPPAERHTAVFGAFETLEPGEALTVINDHDPSPLLHQMEAELATFDAEASTVERAGSNRYEARLEKTSGPDGTDEGGTHETSVREALATVMDPDLGVDVMESGLVKSIDVQTGGDSTPSEVTVRIEATGMDGSTVDDLEDEIEAAVGSGTTFDDVDVRRMGTGGGRSVSADEVLERLSDVSHPDQTTNVVETGLVSDVEVTDGAVTVSLDEPELAGDLEDIRGEFLQLVGEAAYNAYGVSQVRIDTGDAVVPIDPPREEDPPLADAPAAGGPPGASGPSPLEHGADQQASAPPTLDLVGIEDVIVIASAKGGVGKTTIATQLARSLSALDRDVGLLDADFSGPDVPQLFELEPQITEGTVVEPVDHDGLEVMSVGLMENPPTAWNGEMIHNALFNLLEDVDWTADTLVVDLPPGASDTLMTFLQFVPIDGVVLVTTPYPTAVADTNTGAALFREGDVSVLGVVVNMAGFACPSCGDEHELFPAADIDDALEYPVLAELPFSPEVRSFTGDPPSTLQALAETVAESLPVEEGSTVPDDAVDVRDLPEHARVEAVEDAFVARDPGTVLTVVSDRNPAGLAVALVDVLDVDESPSEVFETYEVDATASDRWVLRVGKPQESEIPRS